MNKVKTFEREIAGRPLKVQIGKFANQAHGSSLVSYGDTVVLATAVIAPVEREGVDYFPLMVDYEERLYAAGKIKGSRFIKREGRATDEAVLKARLIDRSIRPLFKDSVRKDVQVVVTVLSVDMENDPDVPSLIAASIALGISPIPWSGPIGATRISKGENGFIVNPVYSEREKSSFDLFVAGTADEVVMIEAEGKQVPEDEVYSAIETAQKEMAPLHAFIREIIDAVGVQKFSEAALSAEDTAAEALITAKVKAFCEQKNIASVYGADKETTKANVHALKIELEALLKADNGVSKEARGTGMDIFNHMVEDAARDLVLQTNKRVDGRGLTEIRALSAEIAVLPRTHGTGLFQRGETQVLSIVTLGAPGDEQTLDTMEESGTKRYMHHYNFPPFSVGEVKPLRGPSRRDIGHGALAEKAIEPLLPSKEVFPYTIRVVSEVLGSNGSSSQASVCGSSLALMDAGVPLAAPCAGIAMGLVTNPNDKNDYRILTDIQGVEDHAGDMDFKIAGTTEGVTAIQLDIKLGGISLRVVKETLAGAREARLKILDAMAEAIAVPRDTLSEYAPRILSVKIPVEKIREVIGSGGKVINEIIEKCGVDAIDIDDDGVVSITSHDAEGGKKALEWVQSIVKEIEIGEIYEGPVTQIVTDRNTGDEIGAIVELAKGKDGMIHISQLRHERIAKVSDVVKVGDIVKVKVMEIDPVKRRISLSIKALLPAPEFPNGGGGFDPSRRPHDVKGPRAPHRGRGDGGFGRNQRHH